MKNSVSERGHWAAMGRYSLAVLVALGLLTCLLFLVVDQPTLAQSPRTTDQAGITVNQTVGTAVGICAPNPVIAVAAGTDVHYCAVIRNTGTTTLLTHTLTANGINNTIVYTLEPGSAISVTTNVLSAPVPADLLDKRIPGNNVGTVITHTVQVTSTDGQGGQALGQATARVVIGSVGLRVSKTIGLTDNCATTKGLAVNSNTLVKYCVTMQNTGTLPLTQHRLVDPLLNVNASFGLTVPPGATLVITDGALRKYDDSQRLEFFITNNLTNTLTFNSSTAEGVSASAQDQAVAVIGQARIAVTNTVGLEAATCGTSPSLTAVSGRTIYHCLRIRNEGTIPLDTHEIRSTAAPIVNRVITQTLPPGQTLVVTNALLAELIQANVTSNVTANFSVTSRARQGIVTADTTQATIAIGTQSFTVNKYATTDPNTCVTQAPLNVSSNQSFYYCLVLTNTGSVPLVRYTLAETSSASVNSSFTYTLTQNQRMTVTNPFIANTLKINTFLGPFSTSAGFSGNMAVTAYSSANVPTTINTSFQINVVATPTPTSTPFPTFTPTISPTPSATPVILPTATATPVVVSFPATPVDPFGVNSVTTPTPIVGAGIPGAPVDAFGQPISPLNPALTVDIQSTLFAQTAEAAATQTAWAFTQPPSVLDTPIPPTAAPVVPSPLESPVPTPTPVEATPTATPLALLSPLATPPTGNSIDNYVDVVAQVFQVSTATLSWVWFVGGSIVFFATAGMFFGLSWLRRRSALAAAYNTNEAADLPDDFGASVASPTQPTNPQSPNDRGDEDFWPASLR